MHEVALLGIFASTLKKNAKVAVIFCSLLLYCYLEKVSSILDKKIKVAVVAVNFIIYLFESFSLKRVFLYVYAQNHCYHCYFESGSRILGQKKVAVGTATYCYLLLPSELNAARGGQ
ncbi:MAG: hypothetical protein QXU18_12050 [Thermoplasmatales archaeon]